VEVLLLNDKLVLLLNDKLVAFIHTGSEYTTLPVTYSD
jgi:hypothetical protein